MIITSKKPIIEMLDGLKGREKVFLAGCALCATTCRTGGQKQVDETAVILEKEGKKITGSVVLEPACSVLEVKRLYRKMNKEIEDSDIVLSLACGGGTQAIAEVIKTKEIYPANNTLFQGEISELSLKRAKFDQKCSLCGDCVLGLTNGICPVTCCPKELVNGPCGGVKNGKCETDKNLDCAWLLIYERLKEFGRLKDLKTIKAPKDHSKNRKPRDLVIK
ncbi:MAG: methylenetetrahydrofolate reductase C-terminal domain-containing protein [Candidatus Omnitrophota bacterium]